MTGLFLCGRWATQRHSGTAGTSDVPSDDLFERFLGLEPFGFDVREPVRDFRLLLQTVGQQRLFRIFVRAAVRKDGVESGFLVRELRHRRV